MEYRFASLEKLIETHIWENDRINKEDRQKTQKLIEQEIMDRAKRLVRILKDTENIEFDLKNKSLEEEVEGIIRWVVNP